MTLGSQMGAACIPHASNNSGVSFNGVPVFACHATTNTGDHMQEAAKKILNCLATGLAALALLAASSQPALAGPPNPLTHAMWIHGNAVVLEHPERVRVKAMGAGIRIERTGASNQTWIHYTIPTPVVVSNIRQKLHSVMIRYVGDRSGYHLDSIQNVSHIREVHVWDANQRIFTSPVLSNTHSEDHNTPFDRFELPQAKLVNFGIVISLLVDFDAGNWIEIDSVGADFTQ